MNGHSPYGSNPGAGYYYRDDFATPSPTPSPRGPAYYASTPQRPATRAHFRHMSSGMNDYSSPHPAAFSPRYNSDGLYSTNAANANRERRSSYSYYRASDSHGESDEDEYVEVNGITYVIPARSRSKRHSRQDEGLYYGYVEGLTTDRHHYAQASSRRQANDYERKATESDAKKYRIPPGYSLKNWDPTEEPILLLGSVFDANSLGKWIYDWTVYTHGPSTPISEMAGEMWLLLIQLAGKIKRSKECVPRIRAIESREMVEDFIESGERITDKLRKLLKTCEQPMLKASKKKEQLGRNSGIEFVETLFGRERELEKSERFMQQVRLWNMRFDANCEEVLKQPTK
ncbi:putative vegetative cell wall protein gp1 [Diaporthe ampelina]|uniref:Putative vegetative cell wall protein gp1 n=1 Tax=Diaporthe ampelina TaxID=1214573 RepID=A0A0G2FNL6_9PEZI|nr:putative vegetative cell wall protein gp1 [Diaporthe ampelina]